MTVQNDSTPRVGGELVFADGDADRALVPRAGRMLGFTSGLDVDEGSALILHSRSLSSIGSPYMKWSGVGCNERKHSSRLENIHRIEPVRAGVRATLAMWFGGAGPTARM